MNFNNRLKELREASNLSQDELANLIGKSKSSINMYERGDREPSIATQRALADIFKVDLDYLTGRSDSANATPVTPSDSDESPIDDKFLTSFGQRVKTAREVREMTQEELGIKCGYGASGAAAMISYIEAGKRNIPITKLSALVAALQVSPTYLLGVAPDSEGNLYSNEVKQLDKLLTVEQKKSLLQFVKKMNKG